MHKGQLTEEQLEKILQGKIDPQSADGAMAYVANLISAAKASPTEEELSQEASILMRFREVQSGGSISEIEPERKRRLLSKLLTAKVIGAALATTALSGTAVAAYDGVLPSSVQNTISSGLSAVGVTVPSSSSTSQSKIQLADTQQTTTTLPSASQKGISNGGIDQGLASGESLFGLCTAYANSSSTSSTSSSDGTTTTTVPSSTTTTAASNSTTTTAAPNSSTTTTAVAGSSGSTEFQRLQSYASQKGETIMQLCANVSHPSPESTAKSSGQKVGELHAASHESTNSPLSSTTTEASGTSGSSASSNDSHGVSESDQGSAHANGKH